MLARPKRDRAVGVVIHNNNLLVIDRLSRGKRYYSLPGGGIDKDESPARAAEREILEETSIRAKAVKLLYHHEYMNHGNHYYFLCKYLQGMPKLGTGDERFRHFKGINEFNPQWLEVSKLAQVQLKPQDAVKLIINDLTKGFSGKARKTTYQRGRL